MVAAETREGVSYQTEVGLTQEAAEECIPPPTRGLRPDQISPKNTNDIFFDLEATGLCNLYYSKFDKHQDLIFISRVSW